jgi:hypothetical protein
VTELISIKSIYMFSIRSDLLYKFLKAVMDALNSRTGSNGSGNNGTTSAPLLPLFCNGSPIAGRIIQICSLVDCSATGKFLITL